MVLALFSQGNGLPNPRGLVRKGPGPETQVGGGGGWGVGGGWGGGGWGVVGGCFVFYFVVVVLCVLVYVFVKGDSFLMCWVCVGHCGIGIGVCGVCGCWWCCFCRLFFVVWSWVLLVCVALGFSVSPLLKSIRQSPHFEHRYSLWTRDVDDRGVHVTPAANYVITL